MDKRNNWLKYILTDKTKQDIEIIQHDINILCQYVIDGLVSITSEETNLYDAMFKSPSQVFKKNLEHTLNIFFVSSKFTKIIKSISDDKIIEHVHLFILANQHRFSGIY